MLICKKPNKNALIFKNSKVSIYPDIQLLSPLQPQVPERAYLVQYYILDQSCNVIQILLVIDNIA